MNPINRRSFLPWLLSPLAALWPSSTPRLSIVPGGRLTLTGGKPVTVAVPPNWHVPDWIPMATSARNLDGSIAICDGWWFYAGERSQGTLNAFIKRLGADQWEWEVVRRASDREVAEAMETSRTSGKSPFIFLEPKRMAGGCPSSLEQAKWSCECFVNHLLGAEFGEVYEQRQQFFRSWLLPISA